MTEQEILDELQAIDRAAKRRGHRTNAERERTLWLKRELKRIQKAVVNAERRDVIPLRVYKQQAIGRVNGEAQNTIVGGLDYNGVTLSTSEAAQRDWTMRYAMRVTASYPYEVSTKDEGRYTVASALDVQSIYEALGSLIETTLAAARDRKDAIAAAATKDEVDAI